jgi:hypothetical protein
LGAVQLALFFVVPSGAPIPAQECREVSQTLHVSNLCFTDNPDGTREKPYQTLVDAFAVVNDPSNQNQHVKLVLLPTEPSKPYQATTIDTPGKCLTIVSDAGPGLTSCERLTVARSQQSVTIQGLYFSTPGSAAITMLVHSSLTIRNCIFHGCGTAIAHERLESPTSDLLVENCVFFACDVALELYHDEKYTFVNCIFARQTRDVLGMVNNDSGDRTTFDYCAFCQNAAIERTGTFYNHQRRNDRECPQDQSIFIDPDTANFQLHEFSGFFNVGHPGRQYLNPDGTRSTLGVYGGPAAIPFPSRSANADAEIVDVQVQQDPETSFLRVRARIRVKQ